MSFFYFPMYHHSYGPVQRKWFEEFYGVSPDITNAPLTPVAPPPAASRPEASASRFLPNSTICRKASASHLFAVAMTAQGCS